MVLDPNRIINLDAKSSGVIEPMTPKPMIVPQVAKETPRRSMYSGTQATEANAACPMKIKVSNIEICALRSLAPGRRCNLLTFRDREHLWSIEKLNSLAAFTLAKGTLFGIDS